MIIGYARASRSEDVSVLDEQVGKLKAAGAREVFCERRWADDDRKELERAIGHLRPEDVLAVTEPHRLARTPADFLVLEKELSGRDIGVLVLSVGGAQLDSRRPNGQHLLSLIGALLDWEQKTRTELHRERAIDRSSDKTSPTRQQRPGPRATAIR